MRNLIRVAALCLFMIILLTSCKEQKDEVAELETEVIAIHDEAMAKTDSLFSLKNSLKIKLGESGDSTNIFELTKILDDADEAMMVWMDQYEAPDANRTKKENLDHLNDQKSKIISVSDAINQAIAKTTNYLNN